MNCKGFQSYLDQFISGELASQEMANCEQHISECETCLVLWSSRLEDSLVSKAERYLTGENEIASAVLQKIGISACEQSESILGEFSEGELDATQQNHVRQHLDSCNGCSALLSTLMLLEAELCNLSEAKPANDFASQVLAKTHPEFSQQKQSWFARITGMEFQSLLIQLMKRPRFPVEAAFAATVVWTGFFGVPAGVNLNVEAQTLPLVDRDTVQQQFVTIQNNINDGMTSLPRLVNAQFQNLTTAGRNVIGNSREVSEQRRSKLRESFSDWINTTILNRSTIEPVEGAGERL